MCSGFPAGPCLVRLSDRQTQSHDLNELERVDSHGSIPATDVDRAQAVEMVVAGRASGGGAVSRRDPCDGR